MTSTESVENGHRPTKAVNSNEATHNVERLLLEHLDQIQASLARIEHKLDEANARASQLELTMATPHRDIDR